MKTAIVFGCTGQDGSLLCKSLLGQGFHVRGVSRSSNPNLTNHVALGISDQVVYEAVDLCDFREVVELFMRAQPDEVYNLSAQSSVGASFQKPVDTFNSIMNATINILEVARFLNCTARFYFAGSSEIFGNTEHRASVQSPRNPVSPYAIAKDASFNTVRLYRNAYGVKCVTGILFNHESQYRGPEYVTMKIIKGALKAARQPTHRIALGNLSVARDWGWAAEYVEAMQLITRASASRDQVICTGRMETLEYFVSTTFSRLGLTWQDHVSISSHLMRPSDISISVGDPGLMIQQNNWKAESDVDDVIDMLLDLVEPDL